jgi:AcrR family transcriptional regulator
MLYRFFSGKAELYAAILNRKSERVPEESYFPPELMERRDDAAVLRAFALRMVGASREDPTFMRLLFNSALEGHELARRFHNVRVAGLLERLATYLELRKSEGAFGPHNPRMAARAFAGQLMQILLSQELFGVGPTSSQAWEAEVDSMVSLLLDGLRARKEVED